MRKMLSFFVALVFVSVIPTVAQAGFIDFENFSQNDIVSGPGKFADVTFSEGTQSIYVDAVAAALGPDFGGVNAVRSQLFTNPDNHFLATFSNPMQSVSVVIGDADADADNIFLTAYDSVNNVIATASDFLPSSFTGGVTLTVTGANIDHVLFGSLFTDTYPNSVYWDNFSYSANVPEPTTLLLLGSGLIGLAGLAWRKN